MNLLGEKRNMRVLVHIWRTIRHDQVQKGGRAIGRNQGDESSLVGWIPYFHITLDFVPHHEQASTLGNTNIIQNNCRTGLLRNWCPFKLTKRHCRFQLDHMKIDNKRTNKTYLTMKTCDYFFPPNMSPMLLVDAQRGHPRAVKIPNLPEWSRGSRITRFVTSHSQFVGECACTPLISGPLHPPFK